MADRATRDLATRTRDTLALLSSPAIDAWVATASGEGLPHLVPLSLGWVEERVVIAVESSSLTAQNLTRSRTARVAVGPTRDVVMVNAVLEDTIDAGAAGAWGEAYAAQADWDPRGDEGYVFLVLRPERIQAWREVNEIPDRTLMREGTWLHEEAGTDVP